MGKIRQFILSCVIRAIKESDEQTRAKVIAEIESLIKDYGIVIGNYSVTDSNGTFTIKKSCQT